MISIELYDIVRLARDMQVRNTMNGLKVELSRGSKGTVVEVYRYSAYYNPDFYEVEFSDSIVATIPLDGLEKWS